MARRAIFFRRKCARAAVVAHAVDVATTGDVRLGGHDVAGAIGAHRQYVWFNDPIVGVGVGAAQLNPQA